MHHFFAYMARMRFIDRWALMRNSYTENIQEHSHQVAILAHALAVLRNEYFGGQVDAGAVAVAALYHDASEILTGDMPTPIKYFNPEIREAYRKVEELVKAADKLSAHIKCLEEQKAGNDEFRAAAHQTRQALEKMHLPEVDLFLRDFLPSFRLTLDELK